jgi:4-hydroxy-3-methylbut-2-en-1-yl diphosphate reductase
MKSFDIPPFYRSPLITAIKAKRKHEDKLKKDFTPTQLDFGKIKFHIARHFGFCYGVENAIEIAFKTVEDNPTKKIYLLSEMIHNPQVNDDLKKHGVSFILDTLGNNYIPWENITKDDIVIIPAFGTTLDTIALLKEKGIEALQYNTTCPFVEKVWKRGSQIGQKGYSIIIHGKPQHEETRATFSQSAQYAPTLVINNMQEAQELASYIKKEKSAEAFFEQFQGRYSDGFDPNIHFKKIGVINQTTMLAEDTQAIADYLKDIIETHIPAVEDVFADTRDTLCYATNDNQSAVKGMLDSTADFALVIGGYNSSNTSHLVELCEEKLPTYYIKDAAEIISKERINHFNFHTNELLQTNDFIPTKEKINVLITAGASCPDAVVENVIKRMTELLEINFDENEIINQFQ